jgi:hypothetical protein
MRLVLATPCPHCNRTVPQMRSLALLEYRDEAWYEVTCSNGHEFRTILQEQKHEILFEIGAHAILDGYYREAVSSFTSSMERFHEFAIRCLLAKLGGPDAEADSAWRQVSNQTERQLGAFIFLWLSNFHEVPGLLSTDEVNFRNAVVHKGKIPTMDAALWFGNRVLDILRPQIRALQWQLPDAVGNVIHRRMRQAMSEMGNDKMTSSMGGGLIMSASSVTSDSENKPLEEHLKNLQRYRAFIDRTRSSLLNGTS